MDFNLAQIVEAIEVTVPDRLCIVHRDRRLTYAQFGERTRRLANVVRSAGFRTPSDRSAAANHETTQDHLALYLHNGSEYLEGMVGAFKARVAPFNVNYRYVAEELEYLLRDASARGVVFHSRFAPILAEVRDRLPGLSLLLQVDDESGHALLDGAQWYETALAEASVELEPEWTASWSPDDLYILYTGGTTGMPKGVLWRQADIWAAAMGGRKLGTPDEWDSLDELCGAARNGGIVLMPGPPFMHGAAHWMAFNAFGAGNTLVLPNVVERFDAADTLQVISAEGVNILLIVGDAFARPLLDEIARDTPDLSSMLMIVSGGAALSAGVKQRLLEAVPWVMIMDGLGASETGQQAAQVTASGQVASTGTFTPGPGMCILSDDLTRLLQPGDDETGWLGQSGRVPLGYLGDEAKTARTFAEIDGTRYAVPGDRARISSDGTLELFGRDSVTINSGGEKIFAEEVEQALVNHTDVADVIVVGRPSPRWGKEVVAVVQLRVGAVPNEASLTEEAARHLARYKLPKQYLFVDRVMRSPSGKADYRWAASQANPEVSPSSLTLNESVRPPALQVSPMPPVPDS